MIVYTIPGAVVPKHQAYRRHVIQSGHLPGVLSGAEIHDGGPRYRSRLAAIALVAALLPVRCGHYRAPGQRGRAARVWVHAETGEPVRLEITD